MKMSPMDVLAISQEPVADRLKWLVDLLIGDMRTAYVGAAQPKRTVLESAQVVTDLFYDMEPHVARNLVEFHLESALRMGRGVRMYRPRKGSWQPTPKPAGANKPRRPLGL